MTVDLDAATTGELLDALAVRMEATQNSDNGRALGRLCREALVRLDANVLARRLGPPLRLPDDLDGVVRYMIRQERRHLDKRERGLTRTFGDDADLSKITASRERLDRIEAWLEGHDRMTVDLPPATVPGEGSYTFASQRRQHPKTGRPGLSYQRTSIVVGTVFAPMLHPLTGEFTPARQTYTLDTDVLLYRNRKGRVVGILYHYPCDVHDVGGTLLERAGNVNIFVDPQRRRRGIGAQLVREASRRFGVDWSAQTYTLAGRELVASVLATVAS